ncbi:MAG TPA: hypothetical protein VKU00_01930 [Chthonomonadaceae bacterium]|nr:hypothetical protein [Chthonomonadaceae bacterium]
MSTQESTLPAPAPPPAPTEPDLRALYPGRDEWLYDVEDNTVWRPVSRDLGGGHRPTLRCKADSCDFDACVKQPEGNSEALRDKIAADLGIILELPVAPCLLRRDAGGGVGMVAKIIGDLALDLNKYQARMQTAYPGIDCRGRISALYPDELFAFDVWIWNIDRHNGNVVHTGFYERADMLYGIDHGHSFGCDGGATSQWANTVPTIGDVQFPNLLTRHFDRDRLIRCAKDIEGLDPKIVEYIAVRAAAVFGTDREEQTARVIAGALTARQGLIVQWAEAKQ